jgi:hypothetical protein
MRMAAWWRRVADAPLWAHAVALGVVLLALVPVIGTGSLFVSDEGAVQAQVELVAETGDWTLVNEQPELDPDLEALPIDRADRTDGDRWAPYVKHPAYVAVLVALDGVLGDAGPIVLGVVGTVLAAAAAAVLVRRVAGGAAPAALWAAGLATPLLFDAYLTMAHAPAAALGGWAAVAAFRSRTGFVAAALVPAVLVGSATLLRAEAALYGVALAFAIVAVAVAARDVVPGAVAAGFVAVVAVAARELNDVLVRAVLDGPALGSASIAGAGSGNFVDDRISGFQFTVVAPNYGTLTTEGMALVVAAVLLAVAAVVARRRPSDALVAALPLVAVVLVAYRATLSTATIPGLLLAAPWLLAGWIGLRRSDLRTGAVLGPAVTGAAFAGAVLLTQYGVGGGGEWGGRYFAVGLPVAVVPATVGLHRLVTALPGPTVRRAGAGVVLTSLTLVVLAVSVLSTAHERADDLRAGVAAARRAAAEDAGEAVPVVGTSGFLGRAVWRPGDPGPFFSAAGERLTELFERFDDGGVDQALVVSRRPDDDGAAIGARWAVERDVALGGGWHVLAFVAA